MGGRISWAQDAHGCKTVYCAVCREVFGRKIKNVVDAREEAERAEKAHRCPGPETVTA